jgi:hypothetical protein
VIGFIWLTATVAGMEDANRDAAWIFQTLDRESYVFVSSRAVLIGEILKGSVEVFHFSGCGWVRQNGLLGGK